MTNTSDRLFVYLQRPDDGTWVTVGRYVHDRARNESRFMYAPSYVDAGLSWSIDPVNLPFIPEKVFIARRYRGLHDVLRDACPDEWGRTLMRRTMDIPQNAPDALYLLKSSNRDRWGALAVGSSPRPSVANLNAPRLDKLEQLVDELTALAEARPAVDAALRQRLVGANSMGGARPKTTVSDGAQFWIVKPYLRTDAVDIPRLEHFCQQWGRASGLRFADTVLHEVTPEQSVVRVLRFDRSGQRRSMTLSGATLLETEYPGNADPVHWNYPYLAEQLARIGVPAEDRRELFGRMIFNAVCGNDDDHPRNHAALFNVAEKRWRLAPAFDVVANPVCTPDRLTLRMSLAIPGISREAALADAMRFGFAGIEEAAAHLDRLLHAIDSGFEAAAPQLSMSLLDIMRERMRANIARLARPAPRR